MNNKNSPLNEVHQMLSVVINGVDYNSLCRYTEVNGIQKSAILYDKIIDYINSQNVHYISRDECNPICRELGMPFLYPSMSEINFETTNPINDNTNYFKIISDDLKFHIVSFCLLISLETLLYSISLISKSNLFSMLSPLPILIYLVLIFNKQKVEGGLSLGKAFSSLFRRGKRNS